MLTRLLLATTLALSGLSLAGCAERPPAAAFTAHPQFRLQSPAHWSVIARDVAAAVDSYLHNLTGKKDPVTLFMARNDGTVFADGFIQELTTAFVRSGYPVAMDGQPDAYAIGIDLTIVRHPPGMEGTGAPGPMTLIGAGIGVVSWVRDLIPWGISAPNFESGIGPAYGRVGRTNTEMLMTVSITKGGYYVYRSSAAYYINDEELWQYQAADGRFSGSLNDLPADAIRYDLGRKPYIQSKVR